MTTAEIKKRPDLVTVIAVYHFIEAALMLIGLLGIGFAALVVLFSAAQEPEVVIPVLALGVGAFFVLLLLAINVAVGWGLLRLQNWARWAAIVLSVFRLLNVPVGTVIGGLTIYYLFQDEAKAVFEGV